MSNPTPHTDNPYDSPAKPAKKKGGCLKWGAVGAAVLVAIAVFSPDNPDPSSSADTSVVAAPAIDTQEADNAAPLADDAQPADNSPAAEQPAEAPANNSASEDVPREYRSALDKAKNYASTMHMSKQGIYEQLTSEFEQFSPEAAQYAVDNLDVDFNEVALEKAKTYSDTMHLSRQGIYEQLTSFAENFTAEEAQFAIDNLDTDYNRNALEKAKSYQQMDMSTGAIYDQLVSFAEGFTPEQAQYAVDNLGQ